VGLDSCNSNPLAEDKTITSRRDRVLRKFHIAAVVNILLWFGGLMTAFLATVFLMVILMDKPFGVQIVSLVGDTEFVFFLVFCDSKSWRGYSLRNRTVQQQLPHLLRIHSLFLSLIFVVLTIALSARPHLPDVWFVESGSWRRSSPFAFVLIFAGSAAAVTEAWILRRMLSRALESASISPNLSAAPHRFIEPNPAASNKRNMRWQILAVSMMYTGMLLLLLGYTALENHYYLTSPQQPNPETGRVYPFNASGIVFYQTLVVKWQLDALKYVSWLLVLGGMVLALWKTPRNLDHSR
jgi:hypothetical protein